MNSDSLIFRITCDKKIILPLEFFESLLTEHRDEVEYLEIVVALVLVQMENDNIIEFNLEFESLDILNAYIDYIRCNYNVENPEIIGDYVIFRPIKEIEISKKYNM